MKKVIITCVCLLGVFLVFYPRHHSAENNGPAAPRDKPADTAKAASSLTDSNTNTAITRTDKDRKEIYESFLTADPIPDAEVVEAFFKEWMEKDPVAAFTAAKGLPDRFTADNERLRFFFDLWVQLLSRDTVAALTCLELDLVPTAVNWKTNADVIKPQFDGLDPSAIAGKLRTIRVSAASRLITTKYAQYLAAKDLEGALSWASSLSPEYGTIAMGPVLKQWNSKDPKASLEYLATAPSAIKKEWAMIQLNRITDMPHREKLKWLDTHIGNTEAAYNGNNNVFESWFTQEPAAAADHVMNETTGQERIAAIRGLTRAKARSGTVDKVLPWIFALTSEDRQVALANIVPNRVNWEFPEMLKLLDTLTPKEHSSGIDLINAIGESAQHIEEKNLSQILEWATARQDSIGEVCFSVVLKNLQQRRPNSVEEVIQGVVGDTAKVRLRQFLQTLK